MGLCDGCRASLIVGHDDSALTLTCGRNTGISIAEHLLTSPAACAATGPLLQLTGLLCQGSASYSTAFAATGTLWIPHAQHTSRHVRPDVDSRSTRSTALQRTVGVRGAPAGDLKKNTPVAIAGLR